MMKPRRLKRMLGSVFTRLLIVTLAAGLAINVTLIVGHLIIRFHTENAFERDLLSNLVLYTEYLVDDLGDPPDQSRAQEIARRTGLVIRFEHPEHAWQTGPLPRFFNLHRAWVHRHTSGMWVGSSRGNHFLRILHGGGELLFIVPRYVRHEEHTLWVVAVMAVLMGLILAGAYFVIRKTLNPLHALKTGVDQVSAGKLAHRIPEAGASELRRLAQAFNDMTRRLDQLLHSKEQLLLDVSHELRSPITRLKVQLEFLKDAETKESLRADVAEMEAMVTTLLESARLRHTAAALNCKPVEMGELIRSLVADVADVKPGVVVGELADVPVVADPEKIKTVLRNLLENALKHTPEDGSEVCVAMTALPDSIEIVVEDKGEGIPAAALPHLFEPFYRPDVSRSRKTGGYGLGLSLCKAIVDAHGGSIEIASTLGESTRVTVTLPRSADSQKL
ncbi:MAG: HAMP domain-containing histidine kinase [Deltaproteobacteria bacterium]|nr:HAMP domain-containing histidine kinase [Deltaproteobacteria bacterium]